MFCPAPQFLFNGPVPVVVFVLLNLKLLYAGLPPNQGIQGKSGIFIFN